MTRLAKAMRCCRLRLILQIQHDFSPGRPTPPICPLHGVDDELSPFSQSVQIDTKELDRRGHPHEFYSYEGLKHYFSTTADNATTQQMFQDSLDCLLANNRADQSKQPLHAKGLALYIA